MRRSCRALRFIPVELDAPGLAAWVDAEAGLTDNGGAFAATFAIEDDDAVVAWFFSRNRADEFGLVSAFLGSEAVRHVLPGGRRDSELIDAARFSEVPVLEFAGRLGTSLAYGGARTSYPGLLSDVKRVADVAVADLIGDDYERYRIDESWDAWAPWFRAVAWDRTFTVLDLDEHRITLIAMTDED